MQALTQTVEERLETETSVNRMSLTLIMLDLHPRFIYTSKMVRKPHGGYTVWERVVQRDG